MSTTAGNGPGPGGLRRKPSPRWPSGAVGAIGSRAAISSETAGRVAGEPAGAGAVGGSLGTVGVGGLVGSGSFLEVQPAPVIQTAATTMADQAMGCREMGI